MANNILAAILGYCELAVSEIPEDQPLYSYLDQIQKAGNRARELVKQILAFSRQEDGEYQPMELQAVVKEVLKLLRASLPSSIEINQHINRDAPPIMGDPAQLHQVIMNLGINALHSMSRDGGILEVVIDTMEFDEDFSSSQGRIEKGQWLLLSIKDNGHGMDQATVARVFDPFFTTKPVGMGTGLGLTVVHNLVRKHKGVIHLYSEPGRGTTFNLYFPVYKGDVSLSDADLQEAPIPRDEGRHILLVDDEEVLALLGKEILEQLGYKVAAYTSTAEALEVFREQRNQFDLVITDFTMPQMNGFSFARTIFQIEPDMPVILVTGNDLTISTQLLEANRISRMLIKPYDKRKLGESIDRILSEKQIGAI